jgi:hypothetical protein
LPEEWRCNTFHDRRRSFATRKRRVLAQLDEATDLAWETGKITEAAIAEAISKHRALRQAEEVDSSLR